MATPELSRSAKRYQELREPEHRTTRRRPSPHLDRRDNGAHSLEMKPPYPLYDVLHAEDDKPPESGLTSPWPHGYTEEDIV